MKVLLTGGAGFIGSHVLDRLITDGHSVTVMDRLDTSGNLNRLERHRGRFRFFFHNLRAPISDYLARQLDPGFDYILHLGAATHVDRSIEAPMEFVQDNVVATCNLLDYARVAGCGRFLYFSTDEVFGPAPDDIRYKEWDRYKSGNPYAATKAGAEELAVAYHNTYKMPVLITHTMNVIGPYQHPEKFVPSTVRKALYGDLVTIHSDKTKTRSGSRFYIHAKAVADAVMFVLKHGTPGDKYNIVGESEVSNLDMARMIAGYVGRPLHYEMTDFHSARPGHDLRYALDGSKLADMGWTPPDTLESGLKDTVEWYLDNPTWLGIDRKAAA